MKDDYSAIGIATLCKLFGKTRHAYYDYSWRSKDNGLKDEIILQMVKEIRISMPCIGTRKLCHILRPQLAEHKLDAGRDYLFELLASNKMLVRARKRKAITTNSHHWMRKYGNLIKELSVIRPGQLWVSDITYIRLTNGFAYLSLITDAYSHKIVGYNLARDLAAGSCIIALQQALSGRTALGQPLIHHSDRGVQYCCKGYVDLLNTSNIAISMTENGDPYENAIAERMNGILKKEFNLYSSQAGFEETSRHVSQSILTYNQTRPHASCDYLTPEEAHQKNGPLKKRWKNYYKSTSAKTKE